MWVARHSTSGRRWLLNSGKANLERYIENVSSVSEEKGCGKPDPEDPGWGVLVWQRGGRHPDVSPIRDGGNS